MSYDEINFRGNTQHITLSYTTEVCAQQIYTIHIDLLRPMGVITQEIFTGYLSDIRFDPWDKLDLFTSNNITYFQTLSSLLIYVGADQVYYGGYSDEPIAIIHSIFCAKI